MAYNPNIHHRKSIRLKGYDYSKEGLYFITICTQNREHLFGEITVGAGYSCPDNDRIKVSRPDTDTKIKLNNIGEIIENEFLNLIKKYQNINLHEYIIMPNHFHCIIEIVSYSVGNNENTEKTGWENLEKTGRENLEKTGRENPAPTIGNIIGYFKYQTTKIYNEIMDIKNDKFLKIWQRNYYEHIIRNEETYLKISNYIINNPLNWKEDRYNES